jgi:hypothetical protein
MRFALLLLVACAGPSHIRDIEGRPLSTTARLDADVAPVIVRCDGRAYSIVTAPPPYSIGAHVATHRPYVRDASVMCAKIRAADE